MSAPILGPTDGNQQKNEDEKPLPGDLTESFFLGEWRVDPVSRCARNSDIEVKIDPRNMRVLQMLAQRPGQIVTQREIESVVWEGVVVTPDSVYQSIRQLRQALGDTKPPAPAKYIETVQRKGYRLVAEVRAKRHDQERVARLDEAADAELHKGSAVRWVAVCVCAVVPALCLLAWMLVSRPKATRLSEAHDSIEAIEPTPEMDVHTLRSIGLIERDRGKAEKALLFLEQALHKQTVTTGERNQIAAELLREIASTKYWLGRDAEALASARRASAIVHRLTSDASPARITASTLLAEILIGMGEYSEAEENVRLSIDLAERYYGFGNADSSKPISMLAKLRHAQGKLPDAERAAREALRLEIEARGANHYRAAQEGMQLSAILIDMERYAEAEKEVRQSIAALERSGARHHPYFLSAQHFLSEALVNLGQLDEAERLLRAELAELSTQASSDWRIGRAAVFLAGALIRRGDFIEAERYVALAEAKLSGAKGWPAERELRSLQKRRAELTSGPAERPSPPSASPLAQQSTSANPTEE